MSASVKRRLPLLKSRWAKVRASKPATDSARPAAKKTYAVGYRAKFVGEIEGVVGGEEKTGKK